MPSISDQEPILLVKGKILNKQEVNLRGVEVKWEAFDRLALLDSP